MLAALSSNMMLFFGRLVLAKYDMEAMNAAASIVLICNIFQIAGLSITTIAEIFVGQHNGAKQFQQVPNSIWQMIWFSLSLGLLFIPVAFWGGEYLVIEKFKLLGIPYFKITMLFGFLVPLLGALASFFVGIGNTVPLIISAVIANIINGFLNIILVFGWNNLITPLGINGAAIATGVALLVQVIFLFGVFYNSSNHKIFHTRLPRFDILQMIKCLKIGTPNALGRILEIAGWATLIAYLSKKGDDYITVQTLCHSLIIMFMFTVEGLSKGVTAMTANAIGQESLRSINIIVRSAMHILSVILLILWIVLWYAPEQTILKLMNQTQFIDQNLIHQVSLAFKGLWIYFSFNGLSLIIWGVLTAGGDTRFIMWTNTLSTWLFAVIPTYIWVTYFPSTAAVPFQYVAPIYGILGFIIVALRFHNQSWLKVNVTNTQQLK
jgi:MATE family multidrug resistance protein